MVGLYTGGVHRPSLAIYLVSLQPARKRELTALTYINCRCDSLGLGDTMQPVLNQEKRWRCSSEVGIAGSECLLRSIPNCPKIAALSSLKNRDGAAQDDQIRPIQRSHTESSASSCTIRFYRWGGRGEKGWSRLAMYGTVHAIPIAPRRCDFDGLLRTDNFSFCRSRCS